MVAVTSAPEEGGTGSAEIVQKRRVPLFVRLAGLLLAAVGLFVAWSYLAPTALGGRDSYVVTDGISMLPTVRSGSLVIVRSQPSYHVGEVVAYWNPQLHSVVLHRIVAIENGRYQFKGDNNPYADAYLARRSNLVGAEWFYSPRLGQLLTNLRQPLVGAIVLALTGMWVAAEKPRPKDGKGRPRWRRAKSVDL